MWLILSHIRLLIKRNAITTISKTMENRTKAQRVRFDSYFDFHFHSKPFDKVEKLIGKWLVVLLN